MVEVGVAGGAIPNLSVEDYLLEGVSEFDAHNGQAVGGECGRVLVRSCLF